MPGSLRTSHNHSDHNNFMRPPNHVFDHENTPIIGEDNRNYNRWGNHNWECVFGEECNPEDEWSDFWTRKYLRDCDRHNRLYLDDNVVVVPQPGSSNINTPVIVANNSTTAMGGLMGNNNDGNNRGNYLLHTIIFIILALVILAVIFKLLK